MRACGSPPPCAANGPVLAETWFEHVSAVRWKTELDGLTRELVIIRIGYLTRVQYVLAQHVPSYALQEGLTQAV